MRQLILISRPNVGRDDFRRYTGATAKTSNSKDNTSAATPQQQGMNIPNAGNATLPTRGCQHSCQGLGAIQMLFLQTTQNSPSDMLVLEFSSSTPMPTPNRFHQHLGPPTQTVYIQGAMRNQSCNHGRSGCSCFGRDGFFTLESTRSKLHLRQPIIGNLQWHRFLFTTILENSPINSFFSSNSPINSLTVTEGVNKTSTRLGGT